MVEIQFLIEMEGGVDTETQFDSSPLDKRIKCMDNKIKC